MTNEQTDRFVVEIHCKEGFEGILMHAVGPQEERPPCDLLTPLEFGCREHARAFAEALLAGDKDALKAVEYWVGASMTVEKVVTFKLLEYDVFSL